MKRKKLKFMNIGEQVLTRSDMKNIMAGSGSGGSGNIYCKISGGSQYSCDSSGYDPLTDCTDACTDMAQQMGTYCEGCAQFP